MSISTSLTPNQAQGSFVDSLDHSPSLLSLMSPSPFTEVPRRLLSLLFTFNSLRGNL